MALYYISLNRLIYRYLPREEPPKKEEALLYYVIISKNINWHRLRHGTGTQICSRNYFLKSRSTTCEKYIWKLILNTFKIYSKIDHFMGTVLLKRPRGSISLYTSKHTKHGLNTIWGVTTQVKAMHCNGLEIPWSQHHRRSTWETKSLSSL